MLNVRTATLALALFVAPTTAAAAAPIVDARPTVAANEPALSPVSFGMRTGLALPSGSVSGAKMSELFGLAMVVDMMVDIRLGGRVVLAPFAGYLQGTVGSALSCPPSDKSCGAFGARAGGMLRTTFARTKDVDAWFSYAFAHEWQSVSTTGDTASFTGNAHHLGIGIDFFVNNVNDRRLGGYVDVGVGGYNKGEVNGVALVDRDMHHWTTIGMQVVY